MAKHKKIWIAWEDDGSIRSKVLSKEMNTEFYTFTRFERDRHLFFLRYPVAILETFLTLIKEKPEVLAVQNPSIVLSFFAAFVKPIFNYRLVIDLHTLYLHPTGIKKSLMKFLNDYSLKHGDIVIVTNAAYKQKIRGKTKQNIWVLPDRIPDFDEKFEKKKLNGKHNILFICTFSADEPWEEVIHAATALDKDTYIYISGRNRLNPKDVPSNVVLTGFLPTKDYQNLLRSVDTVIVLTEQEDCLVCGGYEAVSAQKPLVLSDKKILREYFSKGTIFTRNNRKDIARSLLTAMTDKESLTQEIRELKQTLRAEWKTRWDELLQEITG